HLEHRGVIATSARHAIRRRSPTWYVILSRETSEKANSSKSHRRIPNIANLFISSGLLRGSPPSTRPARGARAREGGMESVEHHAPRLSVCGQDRLGPSRGELGLDRDPGSEDAALT